jgi:hypothetical protein
MGHKLAATQILCNDPDVAAALALEGVRCLVGPAAEARGLGQKRRPRRWPGGGMSVLLRRSQPVSATLYLRGKRWSVGWNGDFIEGLLRQRRRSYGIAGSEGSR